MTSPVVSVSWLSHHLLEPALRIVDVRWYLDAAGRGASEYEASHIPGALFLDLDEDLSAPEGAGRHPLPDPDRLAAVLGSVGIGNDDHVVVYDEGSGGVAARLWWMLHHVGHGSVSVLDGGFAAWTSAEYPVTAAVYRWEPTVFHASVRSDDTIGREELAERLGTVVLLDARASERYEGKHEPVDPVAGHIPTARSMPHAANLTEAGILKPPADLQSRFRSLGVEPGREVVAYCGSGVTACHLLLAVEVAGIEGAKLYVGSWSDWSRAGLPVAVGPDAGEPPS